MSNRTPRIITCSLLLYRCLLTLAPDEFAREYVDPALQVFRQCCRDAYDEQGIYGVLRLWWPTFSDALRAILAEQGATLKQVLYPRLIWSIVLALGCVLFPFSWLSNAWVPFGSIFKFIFSTPEAYFTGHVVLFCVVGLVVLHSLPALHKHVQLYILCLMLGAFAQEIIQILCRAHPGLHKDAYNLFLDLCGAMLAYLLLRFRHSRRFSGKIMDGPSF